nr:MAG TPA: transmembrane protein [Caudoviricetes sp.]
MEYIDSLLAFALCILPFITCITLGVFLYEKYVENSPERFEKWSNFCNKYLP